MKSDYFSRFSILFLFMTLFQSLQIAIAEDICPICRETLGASLTTQLSCKHTFHKDCIRKVMQNLGAECPMCRQVDPEFNEQFELIRQQLFPLLQYDQLREFGESPSDLGNIVGSDSPLVQQQVHQEALARTYDDLNRRKNCLQQQQRIYQSAEFPPQHQLQQNQIAMRVCITCITALMVYIILRLTYSPQ